MSAMTWTPEASMSQSLTVLCTIFLASAVTICACFNFRIIWIGVKHVSSSFSNWSFSPFLLNICCVDIIQTGVYSPLITTFLTASNWNPNKASRCALDMLFLTFFLNTTFSLLLYNLNRHCLMVYRHSYPEVYGDARKNSMVLGMVWVVSLSIALSYLGLYPSNEHTLMIFMFSNSITYSIIFTTLCYGLSVIIMIICLIKIYASILYKRTDLPLFLNNHQEHSVWRERLLPDNIETCKGTVAATSVHILCTAPWVTYQWLKSIKVLTTLDQRTEILLVCVLIFGAGIKIAVYSLFCGHLRREFFDVCQTRASYDVGSSTVVQNEIVQQTFSA